MPLKENIPWKWIPSTLRLVLFFMNNNTFDYIWDEEIQQLWIALLSKIAGLEIKDWDISLLPLHKVFSYVCSPNTIILDTLIRKGVLNYWWSQVKPSMRTFIMYWV